MAMTYQNFASLGVNLNRQKYGPLDISNVFTSAADLQYYLTKGAYTEGVSEYWYKNANEKIVPYPYEGQVLATVIDGVVNVYALSLDAEGNFQTQEIAGKIEVDGTTIVKDAEGKLSIVAPVDPDSTKTYNFSYANGVYSWVEVDTATAAGQAQAIQGLTDRTVALEEAVNGKGEGEEHVAGLAEKTDANAKAISDEASARDTADQAILDKIGDVVENKTVVGMISDAEKVAKDYADGLAGNYDAAGAAATAEQNAKDYADGLAGNYDASGSAAQALVDAKAYADGLASNYDAKGDAAQALADAKAYADGLAGNYDAAGSASDALDSAKTYTDEQITGLEVVIEKKENVDYIVIKNAAGTEVASVDASKFVQDSFLDDVAYNAESGKITFTWTMGDGSTKTDEVAVADFVQVYAAGNGLSLSGNEFSVDTSVIATVSALDEVRALADAAQTADEVSAAISAAITAENLGQYAKASEVEIELGKKVNQSAYDADKATFAIEESVATRLAGKVDNATLDGYYTKTEVDNHGFAVASEVASTYATIASLQTHEQTIANDLLAYAKTADVNAELAKKIETGSIAHSSETLAEGVTVDGTALKIVVDAYTKEETRDYVAEVIRDMTGGESAADVLRDLNAHITTYTEKVGQIDAKDAAQDTAIAKAQADATQGITDAKKVSDDLVTANLAIAENARQIGVVDGKITTVNNTLTEKITALEGKDTAIEGNITALQTTVSGHTTAITEHGTAITALQDKDTELAALIQGNTNKFADYYTSTQVDAKVKEVADVVAAIDLDPYAKTADVNAALDLKANAADVYTKDAADAAFMTQDEVDSRINALIVAADPEGGKTITDIQNLVKYVDENAGEIASLVTATNANTDKLAGIESTVVDYVTGHIAKVVTPKASAEVTVAEDGTLGIGEVSTDKLVMGTKTLVLNGGDAEVAAAE